MPPRQREDEDDPPLDGANAWREWRLRHDPSEPPDAGESAPGEGPSGNDAHSEFEALLELGLIGKQVPRKRVQGIWMRATGLLPLSTVEGSNVRAFSPVQPYGVLTVLLWTDPDATTPGARAMLPITHRDDFRALYWVFEEQHLHEKTNVWVMYSPAKGFGSRLKASIAISAENGDEVVQIKGAQERLDL